MEISMDLFLARMLFNILNTWMIITNALAIDSREVKFPDDSTDLFFLHVIASGS